MVLSSVVSSSSGANKSVSAETHPDGAHSAHSDSRYATITEPVLLSLVSPSVPRHGKIRQNFLARSKKFPTRTWYFWPEAKTGWSVTRPVFLRANPIRTIFYFYPISTSQNIKQNYKWIIGYLIWQRIITYKKFTILKINFIIYYQLWLALYFNWDIH